MKIAKFISAIRDRPVLYDSYHPQHKDRKEKDKIWREISAAMNIHSDVARNRWKSLKDCYTKYLKSTTATGPSVYLRYNNWQWAQHMEFMKPHIKFGIIMSNIELLDNQETGDIGTQSSTNMQSYQPKPEHEVLLKTCESPDQSRTPEQFEVDELSDTHENTVNQNTSRSYENPKRLKISKTPERIKEQVRKRRRNITPTAHDDIAPDNYGIVEYLENKRIDSFSATELIFLGYAKAIKTFSIRRQVQVKMKIAKIMMMEEIANFEESM